jgi:hypothetical protein
MTTPFLAPKELRQLDESNRKLVEEALSKLATVRSAQSTEISTL